MPLECFGEFNESVNISNSFAPGKYTGGRCGSYNFVDRTGAGEPEDTKLFRPVPVFIVFSVDIFI